MNRRIGAAALAMSSILSAGTALAQSASQTVSDMILKHYAYQGKMTMPKGWCFHTIVDHSLHWWYLKSKNDKPAAPFQPTNQAYAYLINRSAAVQTVYKEASGHVGLSLIIIGLQLGEAQSYLGPYTYFNAMNLDATPKSAPATMSGAYTPILAPVSDDCVSLAEYIDLFVSPFKVSKVDYATPDFDEDTEKGALYRYWHFGGRYHNATGIWRIKVQLQLRTDTTVYRNAFLIVGYGGASGP